MRPELVLFDLDGTLCDTLDDLTAAVNVVLEGFGRAPVDRDTVRQRVGWGARALIRQCLGVPEDGLEAAYRRFLEVYGQACLVRTAPYPGVVRGLRRLAGIGKIVLSNKPEGMCRTILEGLGLAAAFAGIYGGDSFEVKKPDPAAVRRILSVHGATPARAVMVGDSRVDLECALGAGVRFVGVTWGYGGLEELRGASRLVADFDELVRLLLGGWS